MQMDEGLDTGDVLLQEKTPISPSETTGDLWHRLSTMGAELLVQTLDQLDTISPQQQDHQASCLAPLLNKAHGQIKWDAPASTVHNLIRGVNPWPGAWTRFRNQTLKIWRAEQAEGQGKPGQVISVDNHPVIATSSQAIRLLEIQLPGKKRTSATNLIHGTRLAVGEFLGDDSYGNC